MHYATTSDGLRIAYWDIGAGPAVVFTGFSAAPHAQWIAQSSIFGSALEKLAQTHHVVAYDTRGNGLSQRGLRKFEWSDVLLDFEAVRARAGVETCCLVGIRHGGPEAMLIAAKYPDQVERLVLWATWPDAAEVFATGQGRLGPALEELVRTDLRLYADTAANTLVDRRYPDAVKEVARGLRDGTSVEDHILMMPFLLAVDATGTLPQIQTRTLVLHPRGVQHPPLSASQQLAMQIGKAELQTIERPGIIRAVGDVGEAIDLVIRFLADWQRQPSATEHARERPAFRTILFTDIEGHTAMMSRLGDAKGREVLREHERITREALAAHGGTEVKTMGDGFLASFGSAQRALECAMALQRAFSALSTEDSALAGLRLRVGLNAGEPIAEDDDLFGASVIAAARIAAKAEGGQVLVADVVRQLVAGKGFLFHDTGEHVLRGLEDPVRLWELRWEAEAASV